MENDIVVICVRERVSKRQRFGAALGAMSFGAPGHGRDVRPRRSRSRRHGRRAAERLADRFMRPTSANRQSDAG